MPGSNNKMTDSKTPRPAGTVLINPASTAAA